MTTLTHTRPSASPAAHEVRSERTRLPELDGLRGVAAMVVVLYHGLLLVPELAAAAYGTAPTTPGAVLLTFTPAHLLWAGQEAVTVFFLLSGLVLTLPAVQGRRFAWLAYYPRRMLRLFGPVFGAVLLASAVFALVPRWQTEEFGRWIQHRPSSYPLEDMLRDFGLLGGTSGAVSPLWSLQWEVAFSLLLPVFVVLAIGSRRAPVLWVAALLGITVAGFLLSVPAMRYLPVFGIGAVLAANWTRLRAAVATHRLPWAPLVALAVAALLARWWAMAAGVRVGTSAYWNALTIVGGALLIVAAVSWRPLRTALARPLPQWLGRISFSLYLVHEPILIAWRFALPTAPDWVPLAAGLPSALVVAWLFWAVVERNCHRLALACGRRLAVTRVSTP